jgi:hypothetical protein
MTDLRRDLPETGTDWEALRERLVSLRPPSPGVAP